MGLYRADAQACSARCRKRVQRAREQRRQVFPEVMTGTDRWVRWTSRGGHKVPLRLDGRNASSTSPASWCSYDEAAASSVGRGLGWVLGAGIGCLDLDDCFDSDGELLPWARKLVDRHSSEAVLIERSISGRGVHIFIPMAIGRGTVERGERNLEVYPPESGRYIALTGDPL